MSALPQSVTRGCACASHAHASEVHAAAPAGVLRVRSLRDLDRLAGLVNSYRAVRLDLPFLSDEQAQQWQQRIEHDYLACGCAQGARALRAGLLPALFAPPAWAAASGAWSWRVAAAAATGLLLLTLGAKAQAVLRARWRLACHLRALRRISATH